MSGLVILLTVEKHLNNTVLFSNRTARQKLGTLPDLPVRHAIAEGILSGDAASRLSGALS